MSASTHGQTWTAMQPNFLTTPTLSVTSGVGEDRRTVWDVAVIGAGPAGGLAAMLAARAGLRVVLFDRESFPRYKVCGCCVNGAALMCLRAAGLGDLTRRMRAPDLTVYWLACGRRAAQVALPAGVAVSRAAFDAALADAAIQAGAEFRPNCRVELLPGSGSESCASTVGVNGARSLRVRTATGEETVTARVVLVAGGLAALQSAAARTHAGVKSIVSPGTWSSTPAAGEIVTGFSGSYIGAGRIVPEAPEMYRRGCVYMSCGAAGYVGWVRLEDDRMNLAAALDPVRVKLAGGVAACVRAVLAGALPTAWPMPWGPGTDADKSGWRGTPALTCEATALAGDRFFVLGDAAGYVEPFTGEGIAWALESALRVQPFVAVACRSLAVDSRWDPAWSAAWTTAQQSWRTPRQRLCRWVAKGLRHPAWVQAGVRILSWMPQLAHPVLEQLNAAPAGLMVGAGLRL